MLLDQASVWSWLKINTQNWHFQLQVGKTGCCQLSTTLPTLTIDRVYSMVEIFISDDVCGSKQDYICISVLSMSVFSCLSFHVCLSVYSPHSWLHPFPPLLEGVSQDTLGIWGVVVLRGTCCRRRRGRGMEHRKTSNRHCMWRRLMDKKSWSLLSLLFSISATLES